MAAHYAELCAESRGRLHRRRPASLADGDRPGAGQPQGGARVGGRQRRRRDGADDRRRRELAALAGRHRGRGQALARRRLRLRRRGAASSTRALALTGRGLIDFSARLTGRRRRRPRGGARDLPRARRRRRRPRWRYSFYAEVAATRGDVDEARRRRRELLAFYDGLPDDPFVIAARAYSRAKLAVLDGDLAAGRAQLPRRRRGLLPDRSAGDAARCAWAWSPTSTSAPATTAAASRTLRGGDRDQRRARAARASRARSLARLGWALLQDGDLVGAEATYERALDVARRLEQPAGVCSSP